MELVGLPAEMAEERRLTYLAEELAQAEVIDDSVLEEDALDIAPSEAEGFASSIAAAAGWTAPDGSPVAVSVVYDVPDESELAAWVDEDGVIHLHPLIANRWMVLHELAHVLDPRDGHSAMFRGRLLDLLDIGLGREVGDVLRSYYLEFGLFFW